MLRKFDSGVRVIQNKSHSDEEVICVILMSCYILMLHMAFMFKKASPFLLFSFSFLSLGSGKGGMFVGL